MAPVFDVYVQTQQSCTRAPEAATHVRGLLSPVNLGARADLKRAALGTLQTLTELTSVHFDCVPTQCYSL